MSVLALRIELPAEWSQRMAAILALRLEEQELPAECTIDVCEYSSIGDLLTVPEWRQS